MKKTTIIVYMVISAMGVVIAAMLVLSLFYWENIFGASLPDGKNHSCSSKNHTVHVERYDLDEVDAWCLDEEGNRDGNYARYHNDGMRTASGKYTDGWPEPNGQFTYWDYDGSSRKGLVIRAITYHDDQGLRAVEESFHPDGDTVQYRITYDKAKVVSKKSYSKNGILDYLAFYDTNERYTREKFYGESGDFTKMTYTYLPDGRYVVRIESSNEEFPLKIYASLITPDGEGPQHCDSKIVFGEPETLVKWSPLKVRIPQSIDIYPMCPTTPEVEKEQPFVQFH